MLWGLEKFGEDDGRTGGVRVLVGWSFSSGHYFSEELGGQGNRIWFMAELGLARRGLELGVKVLLLCVEDFTVSFSWDISEVLTAIGVGFGF